MSRTLRDGAGALLVLSALVTLFFSVTELRGHDYVAALLLVVVGLALVRAGVELLRPAVGE
jgi:hypothetical protein